MPILCATDFSESAGRAVALAAALAKRLDDRLVLAHVVEPVVTALPYAIDTTGAIDKSLREAADAAITASVEELRAQKIAAEGRVLFGTARASILALATEIAPQMIVVGTHGRKGVARLFLGSVAGSLVKAARCPVIVCGAHPIDLAKWQSDAPLRLAVGFDATRASQAAIAWTGAMPPGFARTVSVVRPYWPMQEADRYGLDLPDDRAKGSPDLLRLLERDARQEIPASIELDGGTIQFRESHVNAAEVVAETAGSLGVDAIVMGVPRHGQEKWDAIEPGALLRAATLPVICVPQAIRVAKPAEEIPDYRSILVVTDLSEASNRAVPKAYGLLKGTGGKVEICHVHERPQPVHATLDLTVAPVLSDAERTEVERRLRGLVPRRAESLGIKSSVSVVESFDTVEAILQTAKRLDVDAIVMTSHGRTGIKRAVAGSVAEEVMRHAAVPVLVIHQPAR